MAQVLSSIILPNNSTYILKDGTIPLEFIVSTNISQSNTLTGATASNELVDGKMFVYRLAYSLTNSVTAATLTLFNKTGTSLGTYPIYLNGNVPCTAEYSAGTMLFMVYYDNKFTIVNPFGMVN